MQGSEENKVAHKIIVVDDSPTQLTAFTIELKLAGFEVVGVSNGRLALETLDKGGFELAIIDLMMPDMNGLELARKIRERHPVVKTMLMSGYVLSPIQLAKVDVGVIGFIPKPHSHDELVAFIHERIDSTDTEDRDLAILGGPFSSKQDAPPVAV